MDIATQNAQRLVGAWLAGEVVTIFNEDFTYSREVEAVEFEKGTWKLDLNQLTITSHTGLKSLSSIKFLSDKKFEVKFPKGKSVRFERL